MVAGVHEAPVEVSPGDGLGEGYRPHLDGLRTVAVYLVVLFHAGVDRFSGGFIGVDVFFVLSGYLVTQLLMRDLRSRGSLRFGRFYARRFRRLLPASFVALMVTAVVYSAIASQAELASAVGAFKAAFLYVANWYFIRQSTDYFAANVNANPVQQFWSLAVEEQFYFVWPILLGGLFAVTRRLGQHSRRVMQVAVAVGGLLSLFWALHLASTSISRAYYGTDARAYQLLAGAFLALSPGLLRRVSRMRVMWLAAPTALAALLVLSTSVVELNPVRRGVVATVAAVLLIVGIEAFRRGPVNAVFSCAPAVYLGKISYGTYLWHWPVIVVALALTDNSISGVSMFAISALVATGLASLSYQVLERPVRQQRFLDRVNPAVIVSGLAISVAAALVLIPNIIDPFQAGAGVTSGATHAGFTPIPDLDYASARSTDGLGLEPAVTQFLPYWNCLGRRSAACTIVKGTGQHILVIGDSHAWMMFPLFAKIAQDENLTLSAAAYGSCPWQRNLAVEASTEGPLHAEKCLEMKRDLYDRVIPELHPDVILVMGNDYITRRPATLYDGDRPVRASGGLDVRQQVRDETRRSLEELKSRAGKVVIIEPDPVTTVDKDPFVCLTKSTVLEQCRFVADPGPSPIEQMYRELADNRTVYDADFDTIMCPFLPICDPVIGRTVVRWDYQHITPKFGVDIAGEVAKNLHDRGILENAPGR